MTQTEKNSYLSYASIKTITELLDQKKVTPQEVLNFFTDRAKKYNSELGAFLEIFPDACNSITGVQFEQKSENGFTKNYLNSIPGLIKDNICQINRTTSCASKILQNYKATYDSTVSKRLKSFGAVSIGRANMDEFAMGSSTETSAFMPAKNPWDLTRVPGGSSGGSGVAVAAGLVPWALGSETGGSVRQPAALMGIVGLKPTYGRVSRYGLVAYGSSLDQIGVFTRTVFDSAIMLSAIAGYDPADSTSSDVEVPDYTSALDGKLPENFTLGVIDNALEAKGIDNEVYKSMQKVIGEYEKLGAKIKRIELPTMDLGAAVYFIISRAEAASNLARFDGVKYGYRAQDVKDLQDLYEKTRSQGFGLEVKSRILVGNYVLSAGHADEFYNSACNVRALIRQEFLSAFEVVDLLFAPVSPTVAFKFGAFKENNLELDLQDYFTCPVNLAGLPALGVPCGFNEDNLPIGFQLIGPDFSEELIFRAAYAYEQVNKWYEKTPEKFS